MQDREPARVGEAQGKKARAVKGGCSWATWSMLGANAAPVAQVSGACSVWTGTSPAWGTISLIPGVRITSCSDSFAGSLGWCLITPPWSPRGARGNIVRPQVSKELQPGEGGPAHLPERPYSAPAFGQSSAPTKYSSGVLALDGLATVYVGGHCRPPCCAPYPEDKRPRFTRVLPK